MCNIIQAVSGQWLQHWRIHTFVHACCTAVSIFLHLEQALARKCCSIDWYRMATTLPSHDQIGLWSLASIIFSWPTLIHCQTLVGEVVWSLLSRTTAGCRACVYLSVLLVLSPIELLLCVAALCYCNIPRVVVSVTLCGPWRKAGGRTQSPAAVWHTTAQRLLGQK